MDYIQKTVEEQIDNLVKGIAKTGIFRLTESEARFRIGQILKTQAALFRKGLGEEKPLSDVKLSDAWSFVKGSNMRRTQTLENWKEAGL